MSTPTEGQRLLEFTEVRRIDHPLTDLPETGILYYYTKECGPQFVWFECPCGRDVYGNGLMHSCGLRLMKSDPNHWDVTEEADGTLTFSPSILVDNTCHFYIRHNKVVWA